MQLGSEPWCSLQRGRTWHHGGRDIVHPGQQLVGQALLFSFPTCADMSRILVARTLSLIGHPAILTPAAAILSVMTQRAPMPVLQLLVLASLCLGVGVITYSWVQVRTGRWRHIDASVPRERLQLHSVLLMLFLGVTAMLWISGQPLRMVLGHASGGLLVFVAWLFRGRLKVSLHASFAVFAGALLWPDIASTSVVLLLALAVAWSRLVLRRHTRQEVLFGLLSGGITGLAFNLLSAP